jgi:hypothetical protein
VAAVVLNSTSPPRRVMPRSPSAAEPGDHPWTPFAQAACEKPRLVDAPAPPAEEQRPEGPPVYGPGAYAGPGSLGGTESALRGPSSSRR